MSNPNPTVTSQTVENETVHTLFSDEHCLAIVGLCSSTGAVIGTKEIVLSRRGEIIAKYVASDAQGSDAWEVASTQDSFKSYWSAAYDYAHNQSLSNEIDARHIWYIVDTSVMSVKHILEQQHAPVTY